MRSKEGSTTRILTKRCGVDNTEAPVHSQLGVDVTMEAVTVSKGRGMRGSVLQKVLVYANYEH